MEPFYMTLPSNVCTDLHTQNSPSNFIITLQNPIALQGKWELCLSEIQFPSNWHNITDNNNYFFINCWEMEAIMHDDLRVLDSDPVVRRNNMFVIDMDVSQFTNHTITRDDYVKKLGSYFDNSVDATQTYKMGDINFTGSNGVYILHLKDYAMKFENYDDNPNFFNNLFYMSQLLGIQGKRFYEQLNGDIKFGGVADTAADFQLNRSLFYRHKIFILKKSPADTDYVFINKAQVNRTITVPVLYQDLKITFNTGYYQTVDKLLIAMNEGINGHGIGDRLAVVLTSNNTVKIFSKNSYLYSLKFDINDNGLGSMLGFETLGYHLPARYDSTSTAEFPIDINRGVYNLFVYCNLVTQQIVGDTTANLMRVVHSGGSETIIHNYSNEGYFKSLSTNYITKVHIVIKSDTDEDIKFTGGKTVVVLYFRPKNLK